MLSLFISSLQRRKALLLYCWPPRLTDRNINVNNNNNKSYIH